MGRKIPVRSEPMPELIDLSQEIYHRCTTHPNHPKAMHFPYITHAESLVVNEGKSSSTVDMINMPDHTATHVDAPRHFGVEWDDQGIDSLPLERFYTEGICLDLSHLAPKALYDVDEIERALEKDDLDLRPNDTVLIYLAHYDRFWGKPEFLSDWPGMTEATAIYFGQKSISAFGVEAVSPGIIGVSNTEIHQACGREGITHYEGLMNLDKLVGRGRFRFIAFPLKFRRGSGSPVRAVALFED
jgi:kynurenine formamidase|tara:strand:- start:208 stop:936 length:729 start_codon:yes stop_codon:yes gene_type:complete